MLCDRCGKEQANTYKKVEMNGRFSFFHLCPKCASQIENNKFKEVNIGETFVEKAEEKKLGAKICPVCFSSFSSIKKNGLVGCSNCYEVFKNEILESISKVQNSKIHCGKGIKNAR